MAEKKLKIGEILVAAGVLKEEQLTEALRSQSQLGGTLGENLDPAGVPHGGGAAEGPLRAAGDAAHQPRQDRSPRRRAAAGQDGNRPAAPPPPHRVRGEAPGGRHGRPHGHLRPVRGGVPVGAQPRSRSSCPRRTSSWPWHSSRRTGTGMPRSSSMRRRRRHGTSGVENTLASMLSVLLSWKGQDLHLSAGADPVDPGRQRDPPAEPPGPQARGDRADDLSRSCRRSSAAIFQENLELDFAFSLHGVGRFRCNLYRQRNSIAFTARHVSEERPVGGGARDPRLPEGIRPEEPGADPHHRAQRPREVDHPRVDRRRRSTGSGRRTSSRSRTPSSSPSGTRTPT